MGLFSKTETFEFKVSGMDCGGCESKVTSVLTKIYGVRKVEASAKDGIVIVKAKGLGSSKIVEGIVEAGFTVE
tara:strand:+ start:479 stop:697 length:219 start_codon:yes stop_codon:yes gene_type:complete